MSVRGSSSDSGLPAGDLSSQPAVGGEADHGAPPGARSVATAQPNESRARATSRTPARRLFRRASAETAAAFLASYYPSTVKGRDERAPSRVPRKHVVLHVEHDRFAAWELAAVHRPVEQWLAMIGDKAAAHVERRESESQRGDKARRRAPSAERVTLKEGAWLAGVSQHVLRTQLASGAVPFERDARGELTIALPDIRRIQKIGRAQVRVPLSHERRAAWERAAGARSLREWIVEISDEAAGYEAEQARSRRTRKSGALPASPASGARQSLAPRRYRGVVQWFSDAKGHGCITGEDGRDVLVNRSAIAQGVFPRLIEGQIVEYELQRRGRERHAVEVIPMHAVAALPR